MGKERVPLSRWIEPVVPARLFRALTAQPGFALSVRGEQFRVEELSAEGTDGGVFAFAWPATSRRNGYT